MQHLAQVLGVSYARLNQWRRGESHIRHAQRSVHERAARYLGIPGIVVQALAQNITLPDLFWPEEEKLEQRIEHGVEQLFADTFLGGFVPAGLRTATPSVKMFVLFLYRELNAAEHCGREHGSAAWLRPVREVLDQL